MRRPGRIIFLFTLLAVASALGQSSYTWRVFKASDGLAESFVTSVSLGQRSNVWVKHFEVDQVTFLTGYKCKTIPAPERGAFRIHESRSGQIWAAHTEGLQEFKNGAWVKYPVREIREEFQAHATRHARAFSIIPIKQSQLLFLLSDQLFQFNNEWPPQSETISLRHVRQTGLGRFADMALGRDGTIWIVGQRGAMRLANGVGSSRVDLQACKLEYSIVSPK